MGLMPATLTRATRCPPTLPTTTARPCPYTKLRCPSRAASVETRSVIHARVCEAIHPGFGPPLSGTQAHFFASQTKPWMQSASMRHWLVGSQYCSVQKPPSGAQMPQLSLQQYSPVPQALLPQGLTLGGHFSTQGAY